MHALATRSTTTDRRRLLDKLVRELMRAEAQALDHAPREARRIGESPPVLALRDVAAHSISMRDRLALALDGPDLAGCRGGIRAAMSTPHPIGTDRVHDAERAYRSALLDLRHGLDVVQVLREVARLEGLFAVIRWCDDWLPARRTLVSRVEAQLAWFAEQPSQPSGPETLDDTGITHT